jgi:hypothetical protein
MEYQTSTKDEETVAQDKAKSMKWWCNFCDFRSNSVHEYLTHSCTEELAKRGIPTQATGQTECR